MGLRIVETGKGAGSRFWGRSARPDGKAAVGV